MLSGTGFLLYPPTMPLMEGSKERAEYGKSEFCILDII
ncbi:MAG: hypothetical protein OJF52_000975 [Nitrospira sp.]|nr:hypothetical protein [Nitrospira sp.]WHZ14140.1 MAG: hypothetical protein OJF52_000975 [Nitrospira sp.]